MKKKYALALLFITTAFSVCEISFGETLSVFKIKTLKGEVSEQSLEVLNVHEQSAYEDDWYTYIEAKPDNKRFVGVFMFKTPNVEGLQKILVNVNTLGEVAYNQRWKFQLRDYVNHKWVTVGNNNDAVGWVWLEQTLSITQNARNYVNSKGIVKLRYSSSNNYDVSNIDLMTIDLLRNTGSGEAEETGETEEDNNNDSESDGSSDESTYHGEWWKPHPDQRLTWQWQISGSLDMGYAVDMYDVDLFDTPKADIAALKQQGKIVICYFSAGTYEGWRSDWREFFPFINNDNYDGDEPPFAKKMEHWDERWLDIRRIDLLAGIMESRLDLAKQKGCDGVEPDNMDAYSNNSIERGKPALTAEDQLVYNRWIAEQAHLRGLSVGLKNDVEQVEQLVDYFDWAMNEECFYYNECDAYEAFISAGKAVFGVEYSGSPNDFCPKANTMGMSWLKKRLSLGAWRIGCEDY